jgi:hypothetical protein
MPPALLASGKVAQIDEALEEASRLATEWVDVVERAPTG